MEPDFFTTQLWPWLISVVIVPLANYAKKMLPTDFPLQSVTIVSIGIYLLLMAINAIFHLGLTYEKMFFMTTTIQWGSQFIHAGNATVTQFLNDGTLRKNRGTNGN